MLNNQDFLSTVLWDTEIVFPYLSNRYILPATWVSKNVEKEHHLNDIQSTTLRIALKIW